MQRFFDLFFAGLALVCLAPLFLPIIIILRLTGEGKVFFKQQRVGRYGRPFGLLKFATMLKDSPNFGSGTITTKDDPRVLPFGKFLRKTKINELPQLINILQGDMSVIGPRPQTQRCFDAFPKQSQDMILQVRPGLSGIGSIVFREEEEMIDVVADPDRLYDEVIMPYKGQLEEWYVARRSISLYFMSIFLTIFGVVFPKSQIYWRFFPSLPRPPILLKEYLSKES